MLPRIAPVSSGSRTAGSDPTVTAFVSAVQESARRWPRHIAPPLISAVVAQDYAAMRRLSNVGVNIATGCGKTPLHWAVARGGPAVLRSLVAMCRRFGLVLHVDAFDVRGLTPLHYAALTRDATAVHDLLELGASVHVRDLNRQTPLMKAANWDDRELCRKLVDGDADVRAADSGGQTALHVAAAANAEAVVRLLVERGCRQDAVDDAGRTPLLLALCRAQPDTSVRSRTPTSVWALLPEVGFPLRADEDGRTELHWAAARGTQDVVWPLLRYTSTRMPHRLRDKEGMTPLMHAIQAHNMDTVKILVELCGCSEEDTDKSGWTALHWAAHCGMAWAVELLQEAGLSVWKADGAGRDVLSLALISQDEETVRAVLQNASFQQRADRGGRTALHYAAIHNHPEAALALLQNGADADAADGQGLTPLGCASYSLAPAVVDILSCYAAISVPAHPRS